MSALTCMRWPFVVSSMLQKSSQEVSCQCDSRCCPPTGQPKLAWLYRTAMLAQRMQFTGHCLQVILEANSWRSFHNIANRLCFGTAQVFSVSIPLLPNQSTKP